MKTALLLHSAAAPPLSASKASITEDENTRVSATTVLTMTVPPRRSREEQLILCANC